MPYAAVTRTHVCLFRAGLLEVVSLWPHPCHLVATCLALGSIASRIVAATVSALPVGSTHGTFGQDRWVQWPRMLRSGGLKVRLAQGNCVGEFKGKGEWQSLW